jgi:hypothetical protein
MLEPSASPTASMAGSAGSPSDIGGRKAQIWRAFFILVPDGQNGRAARFFSESAVFLRTFGLRGFSTVLKNYLVSAACANGGATHFAIDIG